MSSIAVIVAPFHTGIRCSRVGKGPHALLNAGLLNALDAAVADTSLVEIASVDAFEGEIGRSFEVMRRIAGAVAAAVASGKFPLVLAGNCNASVGTFAGLGDADAGIVWFDAHADFDTPDEAMSGYFDGMGVATIAGRCWHRLANTVPGFRPLDLSRFVYCGVRDFEPGQREVVEAHNIRAVYGSGDCTVDLASELDAALSQFPAQRALVHLDLDCLDTTVGHANEYAAPGGLTTDGLAACMAVLTSRLKPAAMTVASFNPDLPGGAAIAAAGVRAIQTIAQAVAKSGVWGAMEQKKRTTASLPVGDCHRSSLCSQTSRIPARIIWR